ncbi:MAG: YhjD/YihY/BrkB family envelope integrity protein [Limisphaerales bacterium]
MLDEKALHAPGQEAKWRRFAHFWVLVWRSFVRNRCPVRASALAYATLLALIPMLAVVMSITSSLLKKEGEAGIEKFIVKLVASVTPPATENMVGSDTAGEGVTAPQISAERTNGVAGSVLGAEPRAGDQTPNQTEHAARPAKRELAETQKAVAGKINSFIQNTQSGALGVTGSVLLIFAAISMLSRIEATFNDIWGVARGRSWFMRIVLYWGVLTLAPILLILALGLATGPHLEGTKKFVSTLPVVGSFFFHFGFQVLPVAVLCLTFAAFYMLMPNTRVDWRAALVGGLVSGLLFHLNNMFSVLYVSRVVSNSKIYGSLALVPVFMIGLYFCWLILLLGAQVAYAFQNRTTYSEEKQVENINQRGREFVALRLMTLIGQRYMRGEVPLGVAEMAEELGVPTRLIQHIMQTLSAARLAVETAGPETAYLPARPMEQITCHDILEAMRSTQGQELATRDEPTRQEVYGEFQRIQEAEREAASSVTMLALAGRAQRQLHQHEVPALDAKQAG